MSNWEFSHNEANNEKLVNNVNKENISKLASKVNKVDIQNVGKQLQNYNVAELKQDSKKLNSDNINTISNAIKNLNIEDVDKFKQYFKLLNSGDYNISELRKYASQINVNDIEKIKLEIKNYISGFSPKYILLYQNIINKLDTDFIDIDKFNSIEILLLISSINRLIKNGKLDIDIIDMVNVVNQSPIQLIKEFDKETQAKLISLMKKIKTDGSLSPRDIKKVISKDLSENDIKVLKKIMEKSIQKNPKLEKEYNKVKGLLNEKQINKLKEISKKNIKNNINFKNITQAAIKKNPELKNNPKYKKLIANLEDGDFKNIDTMNNEDMKMIKNLVNMEVQEIDKEDKIKLLKNLNQVIEQEKNLPFNSQTTINEYKNEQLENSNQRWMHTQLSSQDNKLKQNQMIVDENNKNATFNKLVNDLSEENITYEKRKKDEQKILNKKRKEKENELEKNEKEWDQAYSEYNAEKNEIKISNIVNIDENARIKTTKANNKICSQILKNIDMLNEVLQESKKELKNLKQQQTICKYQMNEQGCSNINELTKKQTNIRLQYKTIKRERLQDQSEFNQNNCTEDKICYKTNVKSRDFALINEFQEYENKYERCVNPYKNKCSCILNDLKKSQVITESDLNVITNYVENKESFTNIKKEKSSYKKYTNTIYLISGGILLIFLLFRIK